MTTILTPRSEPFGVQIKFCVPKQTTLVVKEESFSFSGGYSVTDDAGLGVIQCSGKAMSLSGRKEFSDAEGNHLFTLRKKNFHIPTLYYGESPSGQTLFEMRSKIRLVGNKFTVAFTDAATKTAVELLIKGDWRHRNASISLAGSGGGGGDGDSVIAQVSKEHFKMKNAFSNKAYYVTVAPNVDLSLISAICIAMDVYQQTRPKTLPLAEDL